MKKISWKVSILALSCLPAAIAVAADLDTGNISNETTSTANVYFNRDLDLTNTLTAVKDPAQPTDSQSTKIATGNISIGQTGVTAQLAVKLAGAGDDPYFTTYATGHDGETKYELDYSVLPTGVTPETMGSLSGFSLFLNSEGRYLVSDDSLQNLDYNVYALGNGDTKIAAGEYTINTTVGVYTP